MQQFIVSRYSKGLSKSAIARELGVSHTTVGYWLKKAGVASRKRNLSPKQIQQIPNLYRSGMSIRAIARSFRVSGPAICTWMKKLGVEVENRPQPGTLDISPEDVRHSYETGATLEEVGSQFGCSGETIRHRLMEAGGKARDRAIQVDEQAVIAAYTGGQTAAEVGVLVGCSGKKVREVLEQAGVPRRAVGPQLALAPKEVTWAAEEYKSGRTIQAVAVDLGVSASTLGVALNRAGVATRRVGGFFRVVHTHGRPIKFGSSWEEMVFQALLDAGETFQFQGDFTRPENLAPTFELWKSPIVNRVYPGKKTTYSWSPDFVIPNLDMILEVKGNYWATRHWARVVRPCVESAYADLPHPVWVLAVDPTHRDWKGIQDLLIRVA